MAKNVYFDRDGNKQEEIRKARGNPNRNNHTKKKNANYGGYDAATKAKTPTMTKERRRLQLTKSQKTALGVSIAILSILLVLQFAVIPDNMLLPTITTLMLGLTCGMLFLFRQTSELKKTTSYKIIQTLLAVIAVFYTVIGTMGIASFIKSIG